MCLNNHTFETNFASQLPNLLNNCG